MLKITILLKKSIFEGIKVGNSEIDRFGNSSDKKLTKKSEKSKSEKLAKLKKPSKYGNSSKFVI